MAVVSSVADIFFAMWTVNSLPRASGNRFVTRFARRCHVDCHGTADQLSSVATPPPKTLYGGGVTAPKTADIRFIPHGVVYSTAVSVLLLGR